LYEEKEVFKSNFVCDLGE